MIRSSKVPVYTSLNLQYQDLILEHTYTSHIIKISCIIQNIKKCVYHVIFKRICQITQRTIIIRKRWMYWPF